MKRAVMNYAGMLDGFNERISDLPSWDSLRADLLGVRDYAYDADPNSSGDGRLANEDIATTPDNLVAGSTLTQHRAPRPPRATRAEMRGSQS